MSSQPDFEASGTASSLPVEADSPSELLSATHLFSVEIQSVQAGVWTGGNGLEHRSLDIDMRLDRVFKGTLTIRTGQQFSLRVQQRREDEFIVSDYHGIWSHVDPQPAPGIGYLVLASSATSSPAELLQDEACRGLLERSYEADVKLAISAERQYQQAWRDAVRPSADRVQSRARALLEFAQEHEEDGRGLWARYVWARLSPAFRERPDEVVPEVAMLVRAEAADPEFRVALFLQLYESMLAVPDPGLIAQAIKSALSLLGEERMAAVRNRLVEVDLYNLVFHAATAAPPAEPEPLTPTAAPRLGVPAAPPRAELLIPDQEDRTALEQLLSGFDTERSQRLAAWLGGGG
jgi:hypothetical protein